MRNFASAAFSAALLLSLAPTKTVADEQLLSCDGLKTMYFRTDSENELDGEVTLVLDGSTLKTDFGVSAELSKSDEFSMTWQRSTNAEQQTFELNTISGLLTHFVSYADQEGGYEPSMAHLYYCRRVQARIVD